jgi:hypothetical protein
MKAFTNERASIEMKYGKRMSVKNYMKIIMASNEDHANDTEIGDRRNVYLPVSNDKKGDHEYFNELADEIENGGREAFIKELEPYVGKVNLKIIPEGQGFQRFEDIIQSADPEIKFIYNIACEGVTQFNHDVGDELRDYSKDFYEWEHDDWVDVPKDLLFELFELWKRGRRDTSRSDKQTLFSKLAKKGAVFFPR